MNSLADDIKDLLVAEFSYVFGTDLFISLQPKTPVDCVTLYDTGGSAPDGTIDGDDVYDRDTLQIIVRNKTYATAITNAYAIRKYLHNKVNFTQGGTNYVRISAMGGVGDISSGSNVSGTAKDSSEFSLNFEAMREVN